MILTGKQIQECEIIRPHVQRGVFNGMSFGEGLAGYDIRIDQDIDLLPTEFSLGSSLEEFVMPTGVVGLVKDKSSWARQGLSVFNTVIEPGWRGFLTLELVNHGYEKLHIPAGSPIAQVLFFQSRYETKAYTGKYQNQKRGPQEARFEDQELSWKSIG